ncbi:PLP-dependent aminotransferase family protein, partial [Salmonella enterica subsp. enterica serovar Bareilly]|nr:PLP-dependent aminotransferase family protein [Salmonella enterica subsp. enterica serovar Bareilly]
VTPAMYDLNFIYPEVTEQTALLRHTLRRLSMSGHLESLLHYLPHAGRHQERVVVADHLKLRGFSAVDPDTVVMVSGAQHGLASVVLSMFSPGDVIAADALTYPGFKALAQTCH